MTSESFNELFENKIKEMHNYTRAYEKCEEHHEKEYGRRRYSSYDSFRLSRKKKLKK